MQAFQAALVTTADRSEAYAMVFYNSSATGGQLKLSLSFGKL